MIRKMGSFRSYVGLDEYEKKHASKQNEQQLQPEFLNGEIVIQEAVDVLKFTSLSKKKGLSGSLFVTNARVVFVTSDNQTLEDSLPLLSINVLWYYENPKTGAGAKKHRKMVKLGPSASCGSDNNHNPNIIPSGSTRVHELLIAYSNFTTSRFSFKCSPIDHGLRICNSIIYHAFPPQLDRLFYFDYSKVTSANWRPPVGQSTINIPSYLEKGTWLKEINTTRCNNAYRISSANENFELCGSLPEWIVVPADLVDVKLISLAEKLKGGRPPHWSWGNSKGAGILRMGKLNSENDSSAENAFFEMLRKTHPEKRPPEIVDLDGDLPVREIKSAFNKLYELCCPESFSHYQELDSRFYSLLDQTRWLHLMLKALSIAQSCANLLVNHQDIVILQEQESRDTACLLSSLIQITIDDRFRTVVGFFSLIQKEWIAFGHPFHSSYMHASPIFLLFLDSVHQLMKQNLLEFEFNDKLLIHVWDSCFDSTRGTFLFDTPQQRRSMDRWNEYTAWDLILASNQQETNKSPGFGFLSSKSSSSSSPSSPSSSSSSTSTAFLPVSLINPLNKLKFKLSPPKATNYLISSVLLCSPSMCDLELWSNLYLNRNVNSFGPSGSGSITVSQPIAAEQIPPKPNPKPNNPTSMSTLSTSVSVSPSRTSRSISASTPTPTPQSTDSETSFIYPLTVTSTTTGRSRPGRDPGVEMKVVDLLLATSTSASSTRYNRNPQQRPQYQHQNPYAPPSPSSSSSILGVSKNSVFREKASSSNAHAPAAMSHMSQARLLAQDVKRRQNPFTHM